jgi:chromosome transmission fidelity protein 4
MDTRQPVARYTHSSNVTGLSFSTISNLLAFTAFDGSFTRWTSPIPSNLPSPTISDDVQAKTVDRLLDDGFDDEDLNIEERGEDIGDDWIVDDDGGAYIAGDEEEIGYKGGRREVGKSISRVGSVLAQTARTGLSDDAVNVTKAQPPFAPGSTSMKNKKRYLGEFSSNPVIPHEEVQESAKTVAFNMIGVVDVTDQETHQVINVEFHDKIARRGYHFQDHHKYTMASLGMSASVFPTAPKPISTIFLDTLHLIPR